uniref:Uncharacterized protein n=1 Tax=Panagrolaimus sp. ES5 TaxID=591445 RepID=A0AC34FNF2_9BILA
MSNRNQKKTFALLTLPTDEKILEILTFNDAEIISDNKYSGKDFMEDASNFLLDLKAKNLEDFNPEDTVYSIWIKKDNFVSYKLEESTLYFINEMKITDDFAENEEFDKLLDCENPKFLVLGSQLSDVRLKQLKERFKAQKTKVMYCTYEDCLKKSASHYLSRFIRAKDWRWNFKLSASTNPKERVPAFPRNRRSNNVFRQPYFYIAILAAIIFAFVISSLLSNSSPELSDDYFKEITKVSKNDKEIYGVLVGAFQDIRLSIHGAQTEKELGVINHKKDKFVNNFVEILGHPKFKALILQIQELRDIELYYNAIKLKLGFLDLSYTFINEDPFIYESILAGANISLNFGEYIRFVMIYPGNMYEIKELQYTEIGYKGNVLKDLPESFNIETVNPDMLRYKVLGSNNPTKIILHSRFSGTAMMQFFKDTVLKDEHQRVIVIEEDYRNFETKFVLQKVRWMFDRSYTRFRIAPGSNKKYMIGFKCGENEYPLIVCDRDEALPFKKSVIIPKTPLQYFVRQYDSGSMRYEELEFSQDAHAYQLSLEVDIDNDINTTSTNSAFLALPQFATILDESFSSKKVPVIAFFGDLSFIYVYSEIFGYKTLEAWNGDSGKDLYISFDEKKPKFFEKATKIFQSTCSSVVHDIIKVMSTAPDEIHSLNPTFGYKLTKDSNNQIWYKFSSFAGTKKSTPTVLMSILLKEHVKIIKRETGETPTKLLFYLFDEFDDASKNRVKKSLKESCKMLEINCGFVKTLSTKFLHM